MGIVERVLGGIFIVYIIVVFIAIFKQKDEIVKRNREYNRRNAENETTVDKWCRQIMQIVVVLTFAIILVCVLSELWVWNLTY